MVDTFAADKRFRNSCFSDKTSLTHTLGRHSVGAFAQCCRWQGTHVFDSQLAPDLSIGLYLGGFSNSPPGVVHAALITLLFTCENGGKFGDSSGIHSTICTFSYQMAKHSGITFILVIPAQNCRRQQCQTVITVLFCSF